VLGGLELYPLGCGRMVAMRNDSDATAGETSGVTKPCSCGALRVPSRHDADHLIVSGGGAGAETEKVL
jgi:hypothetical protein